MTVVVGLLEISRRRASESCETGTANDANIAVYDADGFPALRTDKDWGVFILSDSTPTIRSLSRPAALLSWVQEQITCCAADDEKFVDKSWGMRVGYYVVYIFPSYTILLTKPLVIRSLMRKWQKYKLLFVYP